MNNLSKYMEVRDQLKTGDCILWQSKSVIGWLIRKFSHAEVNHASLVITLDEYDENRKFLLEALDDGIVLRVLSKRLEEFKGKVWWLPLLPKYGKNRNKVGGWALRQVGVKYDYYSLFLQAVCRVSADMKKFFCSEFCFIGWREGGIRLKGKAPRPGDIVDLGIFNEMIRIL